MKLIVKVRELRYAGKAHLRGETFEATDKHAHALKITGKAEDAPLRKPIRKAATPAPKAPPAPSPAAAPTKRPPFYRTRRITAKG